MDTYTYFIQNSLYDNEEPKYKKLNWSSYLSYDYFTYICMYIGLYLSGLGYVAKFVRN